MEEKHYRIIQALEALAHPIRLRTVLILNERGEENVSGIAEEIGCSSNQVSEHLKPLRNRNLVQYRHEGRNVYYSLKQDDVVDHVLELGDMLSR